MTSHIWRQLMVGDVMVVVVWRQYYVTSRCRHVVVGGSDGRRRRRQSVGVSVLWARRRRGRATASTPATSPLTTRSQFHVRREATSPTRRLRRRGIRVLGPAHSWVSPRRSGAGRIRRWAWRANDLNEGGRSGGRRATPQRPVRRPSPEHSVRNDQFAMITDDIRCRCRALAGSQITARSLYAFSYSTTHHSAVSITLSHFSTIYASNHYAYPWRMAGWVG